ncbi:MAG: hypothetical protein AAF533_21025 [Acidobacteriota bacterium]
MDAYVELSPPARADLFIDNQARTFCLFAVGLGGASPDEFKRDWADAVRAEVAMAVGMETKAETIAVRLVLGPLSAEEEASWNGRFVSVLRLPMGLLSFRGGQALESAAAPVSDNAQYQHAGVPPGRYRVEVHERFAGMEELDGYPFLVRLELIDDDEPVEVVIPSIGRHPCGSGEQGPGAPPVEDDLRD